MEREVGSRRGLIGQIVEDVQGCASKASNDGRLKLANVIQCPRHGSAAYLWTHQDLRATLKYVVEEQGD